MVLEIYFPLEVKLGALVYPIKNKLNSLWKLRSIFFSALHDSMEKEILLRGFTRLPDGRYKSPESETIIIYEDSDIYPYIVSGRDYFKLSHDQIFSIITSPTLTCSESPHIPEYNIDHKVFPSLQTIIVGTLVKDPDVLLEEYFDIKDKLRMFRFVDQVYKDLAWVKVLTPLGFKYESVNDDPTEHPDQYGYSMIIDGKKYYLVIDGRISSLSSVFSKHIKDLSIAELLTGDKC